MGVIGAGVAGMATRPWLGIAEAADGPDSDLVVFNAKVYTVDSAAPKAEAFAVKNGRFTAIGTSAEIRGLAGKGTQTYDARGMTVVDWGPASPVGMKRRWLLSGFGMEWKANS